MLLAYAKGEIPKTYVPTVFENFSHTVTYKGEEYILHLWDTAGLFFLSSISNNNLIFWLNERMSSWDWGYLMELI